MAKRKTPHSPAERKKLAEKAKAQWAERTSLLRLNGSKVHEMKPPPPNCEALIREAIAEYGACVHAICEHLGCSRMLFYNWLERFPELKAAYAEGRAVMEEKLLSTLYVQALNGCFVAGMFLLKAKFGYRDAGPSLNADETPQQTASKIRQLLQAMDAADRDPNAKSEPVQ